VGKSKSVLVTGATGFIGQATVASLRQSGWAVFRGSRSVVRLKTNDEIYLDLNDPVAILSLERSHRFDAIVHLGANIGWSGASEAEMFTPNVLATGCLTFLASRWNAHVIYASAAIVCGVKTEKIDVKTPTFADTAYAHSKLLGEQLLEASQAPHCILRIGGVFGVGGPRHLGLNRAIDEALNGQVPTQSGSGAALRNYIYVKDVAVAIVFALQQRIEGIHLLAGAEVTSVSQMLQEISLAFLNGRQPTITGGQETTNQVIESSHYLPKSRSFREALSDIKGVYQ